jgi:hypothetical protein
VHHIGDDHEFLHPNASPTETPIFPIKRADVDSKKFRNKFVISVDGERFDPGNGIICEIHEGLATFIADSKLKKYRPGAFYPPVQETEDVRPTWPLQNFFQNNVNWQRRMEDEYLSLVHQEGLKAYTVGGDFEGAPPFNPDAEESDGNIPMGISSGSPSDGDPFEGGPSVSSVGHGSSVGHKRALEEVSEIAGGRGQHILQSPSAPSQLQQQPEHS